MVRSAAAAARPGPSSATLFRFRSSSCHVVSFAVSGPQPTSINHINTSSIPARSPLSSSTVAARFSTASASSQSSDKGGDHNDKQQKKKSSSAAADEPNIFLDNIGKIFLGAIGAVVLMLVRSSRATSDRTALRDYIEHHALLDPLEIDDLRVANSLLTVEVFERIMQDCYEAFPSGRASYEDFVSVVMTTMRRLKGEAFTVQLGHLIDRVAIAAIEREVELESEIVGGGTATSAGSPEHIDSVKKQLPLPLLFAVLSLTLHGDVSDRVRLLFEAMEHDNSASGRSGGEEGTVSEADIIKMVDYLQRTCQLVPDAQIVQTETKYPVQGYRRGTPAELVGCAKKLMADDGLWDEETRKGGGGGGDDVRYDRSDFHRVLRTKQVCAWGECYRKTKNIE